MIILIVTSTCHIPLIIRHIFNGSSLLGPKYVNLSDAVGTSHTER